MAEILNLLPSTLYLMSNILIDLATSFGIIALHGLLLTALLLSQTQARWKIARHLLGIHLIVSLALLLISFSQPNAQLNTLFSFTPLSMVMMTLISFIGLVVLRFAQQNLLGDPDHARFLKWYLLTLIAVSITVTANHLVLLFVAWMSISLSLHNLLLFYPQRPRAALAAHKKFLFARLSEALLLSAFIILYWQHDSLHINVLMAQYTDNYTPSLADQLAMVMLALVALIKCAQLPLHGWLIQVVEAPTPVSALLHAGIINLGGFLLLLFSPLLSVSVAAQWLILIVAGISCVLAALIMMTRISIKVRLAWSTVTQMGLMLIECALGLYEIALLHLIAHSCYKAHAFLSSGNAVNNYLGQQFTQSAKPNKHHWLAALSCVLVIGISLVVVLSLLTPQTGWSSLSAPALISPWLLISIAVVSLLAYHFSNPNKHSTSKALITAVIGVSIYSLLSLITHQIVPSHINTQVSADIWISVLFTGLFITFLWLQYTNNTASRQLLITLNAGLYLDEWVTRITLRLWPVALPKTSAKTIK